MVEGVAYKTRGVNGGATLERGAGLNVVVERGLVVVIGVRMAGSPSLGFWFGLSFMCGPLRYLPTLRDRWDRDVWGAVSPRLVLRACVR